MFQRKMLVAALLCGAAVILLPMTIHAAEPFPGYTWRELCAGNQGIASPFYASWGFTDDKSHRLSFEQALAGYPEAVAAFLDVSPLTDGEHSFTHRRMVLLILARFGDRSFCRQLSRRSQRVRQHVGVGLYFDLQDPAYQKILPARYPRAAALAQFCWDANRSDHAVQRTVSRSAPGCR